MFFCDKNKNFCCWVLDFVEFFFLKRKEAIGSKMGTVREKIGKEGFEITLRCIYDLLSQRGYKTQKAFD